MRRGPRARLGERLECRYSAVDAIRRYVFGFVNSHDFSVCKLMSEDYLLHMGDSEVVGREAAYIPAVQHQIDQFPDMGMTVHDVITDGEHVVLHFSEHGAYLRRRRRSVAGGTRAERQEWRSSASPQKK